MTDQEIINTKNIKSLRVALAHEQSRADGLIDRVRQAEAQIAQLRQDLTQCRQHMTAIAAGGRYGNH
jgi:hypothetical protein